MVIAGYLLNDLISFSEKASEIAQCLRKRDDLFESIVEEKNDQNGKNGRFKHDFKTVADVLIQQALKWFIRLKYPKINEVKGEENNKFTNADGATIEIELNNNPKELEHLLIGLIGNQNSDVIKVIVDIIYKDEDSLNANKDRYKSVDPKLFEEEIDDDDVGIYIDPIDCTNEYVKGIWNRAENQSFALNGLQCVSCLIGCFSKKNGNAFMGVINLPFYTHESNSFYSKYIWGVSFKSINSNNIEPSDRTNQSSETKRLKIVLSSAENKEVIEKLQPYYDLVFASGLGYKLFLVLTNQVDVFLITRATSFKWDSCAADAIFKSIKFKNANLVELTKLINRSPINPHQVTEYELKYNTDVCVNNDGLIGYLDYNLLNEILFKLKN